MRPTTHRPTMLSIAAGAMMCLQTTASSSTDVFQVPAFAQDPQILQPAVTDPALGPAKGVFRAGRLLELHPLAEEKVAAAGAEVRVVIRSHGAQAVVEAHRDEAAPAPTWPFTPDRAGTYTLATTSVSSPADDGSRVFTSEKLFLNIAPSDPAAQGAGPSASASARFGHPIELTPLLDPTHLVVGSDLPVRLRLNGSSMRGATVSVRASAVAGWRGRIAEPDRETPVDQRDQQESPEQTLHMTTDRLGAVIIPIRSAGRWTISAELRPQAEGEDAPPADTYTASITFLVSDETPRQADEPERGGEERMLRMAGVWQPWGPDPIGGEEYTGRIAALACSGADPDRYFVGGADGGVWRTTDGGATWTPLTDDMPTTAIGALAIAPADDDVIYAGTGEANFAYHSRFGLGLLKSTDGGDSWAVLAESTFAGRCFSRILVDPVDSAIVYASITPAGGFIPAPASAAKGHPQASDPVGVFKSTDGGASWSQLTSGLPAIAATDMAMHESDPMRLYAAIGSIFGDSANGIYRSDDGGASWTRLAGGLPTTDVGRISLAVAPSDPLRLYAAITGAASSTGGSAELRGVYRSDDGGDSWSQTSIGNYMSSYGWYLNTVSVQPTNPDAVVVGGLTAHRSTNAGASWSDITPPHVDLHAFAWDASGRLLAGDDGGLHRTTNLGGSWTPLNDGLGIIQFYAGLSLDPIAHDVLYGGTQDNGTNKRLAPGSWIHIFGGDGGCTAVNPDNPNIVFAEYQGTGNLFRSTSGGSGFSWSASGINSSDRNCFLPPFEIDPSNPQRMVYGTHRVYRSTSGGTSWTAISDDLTATSTGAIHSLAIAPSDSQTIWATTNDGNVQVTFNNGADWSLVRQNLPGWFRIMRQITVAPDNHLVAYVAGSAFGIDNVLRTTDGGQSWTALDGDLPDMPVNVIAVDTRPSIDVLYAGTEAGVFRSVDDGASWQRFGQGMPNTAVIDLRLDVDRARLVAATQGRGAWKIDLCPADVNGDQIIDVQDLLQLLAAWGNTSGPEDINGDGLVDVLDLLELLSAWGPC